MKKFLFSMVVMVALAACNNEAGNSESVGDSLQQDPTTGQPITTEPDTVGPNDSAHTNH
jgi:hypothetical protein